MHQGIDPNAVKRQKRAAAQWEGLTLAEGLAIYLAERDQLQFALVADSTSTLQAS
ncbi:hypothetical protein [Lysobacter soli]|uniref:hypothetical protein n=1 Tax=Lysobacter soli TaxID=453783 RepID=UPI00240EB953|nr:hypothetical protein [Lysobacter soli]MDG2518877.1 hypothetical protein [Lysobacter soli]